MENQRKPSLTDILGQQALDLLHQAGLSNIQLGADGKINAIHIDTTWPTERTYDDIKIEIVGDKIMINGKVTSRTTLDGKII